MESSDTTQDSPRIPSVLAVLAGGGAIAWMLYQNGIEMLKHWFFYPSFLLLAITCISLFSGVGTGLRRFAWTLCMWWSGFWTLVFLATFAVPPFSMLMVGSLVAPILEAGRIGPFSAGFLHLFMWTCAKNVVKHINTEEAQQVGTSNGG
jgi:hypothetical protein